METKRIYEMKIKYGARRRFSLLLIERQDDRGKDNLYVKHQIEIVNQ